MSERWQRIKPEQVSKVMNFDAANPTWHYCKSDSSMAAKQAEGVAGLWNLLAENSLALLADEVGMGKTYQAIGVMLWLWQQRPDARILVMAPNRSICHNWQKEFTTFFDKHYRDTAESQKPEKSRYQPILFTRLEALATSVEENPCHFYLATIHSLSGLVKDKTSNLLDKAEEEGERYRRQIKKAIGQFDLIIIDEAHYLRNRGRSQRNMAAEGFFGQEGDRLGEKALLLTATPNHSAARNIYDIFSYFTRLPATFSETDISALMKTYGIRRLRQMRGKEGRSFNKYQYRREQATPVDFSASPDAELFFAFYQQQLVEDHLESGEKRAFLYGYLEGFESVGSQSLEENGASEADEEPSRKDFNNAPDSDLLKRLARQFHDIYHRFPDHPKYDAIVKACVPEALFERRQIISDNKHLVFVRRIPSVRELTQRINAGYDETMARKILSVLVPDALEKTLNAWRKQRWSRQMFNRIVNRQDIQHDENMVEIDSERAEEQEQNEGDKKIASQIAELFVVKREEKKQTDCAKVSLRFRRPESLFSLFLEPASDYEKGEYHWYYLKPRESRHDRKQRESYSDAAKDARQAKGKPSDRAVNDYQQSLPTAWGLMYRLLPEKSRNQLRAWKAKDPRILENFGNYLRAGYLFASPVMVELYCWFTELNRTQQESDVQKRYFSFTQWVTKKLPDSLMLNYFIAAIETFETLCEKIAEHQLEGADQPWRELVSLNSPAWYASGQSDNRERLIIGFNSPFYPNTLVATSVLQEGVNLHLNCHKVHHYGIAWTPGDNEQRVGRVDRLFGQVNAMLREQGSATLDIHYPYLAGSFDEDQLASFLRLKRSVEEKLDACEQPTFNREINLRNSETDLQRWLRQPDNTQLQDPYPATFKKK